MINKINKLPKSEFIKVFANILENARWIAEELYNQKPFDNFEELSSKMLNIFETATKETSLEFISAFVQHLIILSDISFIFVFTSVCIMFLTADQNHSW